MACPNINSPQWKALVEKIGFVEAFREFIKHGELIPPAENYEPTLKGVDASTKMLRALTHPKAATLFKAFFQSNPDKFYQELMQNAGATKQQIELLKGLNAKKAPSSISEMAANLLAETSYTVQIKEAGVFSQGVYGDAEGSYFVHDGWTYEERGGAAPGFEYTKVDEVDTDNRYIPNERYVAITRDEFEQVRRKAGLDNEMSPTQHYSNLTVPGGTNYRENRIVTPDIEPTIKGHAQFAKSNDIGWFRSDDQISRTEMEDREQKMLGSTQFEEGIGEDDWGMKVTTTSTELASIRNASTKTRRILEVQSDLFQKGRNKEWLTDVDDMMHIQFQYDGAKYLVKEYSVNITHENGHTEYVDWRELGGRSDEQIIRDAVADHNKKNTKGKKEDAFLKLLRDDNNWVSFFVQSIIQDSVRRGYEKVLFPSGNTAAKIEDHETLENYISTREERIREIKENEDKWMNDYQNGRVEDQGGIFKKLGDRYTYTSIIGGSRNRPSTKEEYENTFKKIMDGMKREKEQFQKELDDARNGTSQLGAVARFYEVDVQNILRKRGYSPVRITDEYGNDWFEVEGKANFKDTIFFNREYDVKSMQYLVDKGLVYREGEKFKVRKGEGNFVSDSVGVIDMLNNRYYQKHGLKPYVIIHESDGTWSVELQSKHDRLTPTDPRGQEVVTGLADKLKERFGINYHVVTLQQAQELLGDKYNGEGAFFHQGAVYFLDGHATLKNVLHEYAHPLVMGIRTQNPRAYNNLFSELENSLDPNVLSIFADVRRLYPEFSEDSNEFKDEVMVRAITANGTDRITQAGFKGFLQRLWYRVKELLRSLFGDNTDLSKLSAKMSIKDLADMLSIAHSKVAIPRSNSEYVLFNRDLARELEQIPNTEVMKNIEMFQAVLQKHLQKLQDGRNYHALRDVLKNESDGSIYSDMNSMLRAIKDLDGSIEQNFTRLRAFANAIMSARMISEKMKGHIFEMRGLGMNEQEELRILTYYNTIVDEWADTFDELRKANANDFPMLRKEIMEASDNFKTIKDYTMEVYERGVVDLLVKELKPLKEEADKEYVQRLADLKQKADNGDKDAKTMHDRLKAEYDKFNYDEEFIRSMLRGEKGDTSRFSGFLMSYTNSPDPIIGGFATFMKKNFMKVESVLQEVSTRFREELKDSYNILGVNRNDPAQLGKQLVSTDRIPTRDEDGKMVAHEVHVFKNEFHNGWLYDYKTAENALEEAKESGDRDAIQTATKAFDELREQFFHREYIDKVYEARKFWEKNDTTRLARDTRSAITNELKTLEALQEQGQEYDEEDMERIEDLQDQLRHLRSLKNPDGSDKTSGHSDPFQNLEIAQALQEYSNLTKDFYQEFEIKGAFKRAHDNHEEALIDRGIQRGTPEFDAAMSKWIRANVRFRLSDKFYSDRQAIIDEIGRVLSKLGPKTAADLDISDRWKKIFDVIRGLRDQDGQPIGTDISDSKVTEVKQMQEEINQIRATLRGLSGLTPEEEEEITNYLDAVQIGINPSQQEYERYTQLINKQQTLGLDPVEKGYLFSLFAALRDFQSKIPTEYYVESMNAKFKEFNMPYQVDVTNADDFLDYSNIGPIMDKYPEFAEWFNKNHLFKGDQWNAGTKEYDSKYERLYIWNRIIPNDDRVKDALARASYKDLYAIQSPYFEARHARKYYFYRIKDEYKTGYDASTRKVHREVGVHVDNRGNWLPKLTAGNRKYIDEDYLRLKASVDPKDKELFKILETYKKYHLGVQKNAPKYGRLWMEVPRRRKERIEIAQEAKRSPVAAAKDTWFNIKGSAVKVKDDLDRNMMRPQDIRDESKIYVMTDLFGNEIQSIPVRYMSKLDKDLVSLDLFGSVMRYAASLENNKMLHDINPIARALEKTLATEGIKAINKVSTTAWLAKHFNISVKSEENTRLQILRNMLERDIEGIQKKMEIGVFGDKVANHIMGLAAFGSLALNIPGGIKNLFVARIQNVLESVSGRNFTGKEWTQATGEFLNRFMPKLIKDYNAFSGKSLETQMWEIFDPIEGKFGENIGHEGSASYSRDIVDFKFTTSPQKFGEINAQGTAWLAMMKHTTVPQTLDGVTTQIPYSQAWEKGSDGVIRLKPGIPETWGRTGEQFLAFKARMHKINELLQGAYAPLNQPEAQRYTLLKLLLFMRKYFAPGLVNRFGIKNPNVPLGQFREGYYITWAKALKAQAKILLGKTANWHLYSAEEKRAVWKTWVEIGYSLMFAGLIALLGYGGGDDDRNKKMAQKSWALQMTVYELMMIKGEVETFIPIPGMGMNELLRMKDNPSIAFPLINRYYKTLGHLVALIKGDEDAYYQKTQGIWEKGDLKLWADLSRLAGYSGSTLHPDVALKNYTMTMNRYN